MANPAIIACPANTWQLVASNIIAGTINIKKTSLNYLYTYRLTGGAAPVAGDVPNSIPVHANQLWIAHPEAIDVYLYAKNEAGSVEVEI